MSSKYNLFVSTTEISADEHGRDLVKSLKKKYPNKFNYFGLGGECLKSVGVKIYRDLSSQSSVGFTEGVRFLRSSVGLLSQIKEYFVKNKIDIVICIDGQGRNIPIAKIAFSMNIKTVYYFPPPVFIWGKWNIKKLHFFDLLLNPFEQNARLYQQAGINAVYTGHPFSNIKVLPKSVAQKKLKFPVGKKVIAIFPGSRVQEIEKLTAIFLDSVKILKDSFPDAIYVISLSHQSFLPHIKDVLDKSKIKVKIIFGQADLILNAANFLITASGTVTLKAAFYKTPMAICYRVSKLTYLILRITIKTKWIGMINILADKTLSMEFINSKCRADLIAEYSESVLSNKKLYNGIIKEYTQVCKRISKSSPYEIMSKKIVSLFKK